MAVIGLIVLICITALFGAYTINFQRTTLSVGKKLTPDNVLLPTGMQDAITPSGQTTRNLVLPLLILVIFIYSLIFFRWYLAFVFAILTFFVITPIFKAFMPKPESNFYLRKIRRNLGRRQETYKTNNDVLRAAMITGIITKCDSLYKEQGKNEPE